MDQREEILTILDVCRTDKNQPVRAAAQETRKLLKEMVGVDTSTIITQQPAKKKDKYQINFQPRNEPRIEIEDENKRVQDEYQSFGKTRPPKRQLKNDDEEDDVSQLSEIGDGYKPKKKQETYQEVNEPPRRRLDEFKRQRSGGRQ